MYTIKRAAEVTGVPETTLRAWERRYRLIRPGRTPAGYRLYDEEALGRISAMRTLIEGGLGAAQAASTVLRADLQRASSDVAVDLSGRAAATSRPIDGRSTTQLIRRLRVAAQRMDPTEASAALDEAFAERSFEAVIDQLLMPALGEIGRGWQHGEIDIAGEHLVSAAVQRRLSALYEAAACESSRHWVLVGLPPGSRHELGILSFAVALRRRGVPTAYLGADVPAGSWTAVAAGQSTSVVVLAVPSRQDAAAAQDVVDALADLSPAPTVCVGGGQQDLAPAGTIRLGHNIRAAAATVALLVTTQAGGGR